MGSTVHLLLLVASGVSACQSASAQLPVAAGRPIALSQPQWRLFIPAGCSPRGDRVDLLVHFHGDPQTVWNNAAHAGLNAVIVTVNYNGLSSAYSEPFADRTLFQQLLDDARTRLVAEPDFAGTSAWGRLAVSSFSAGYGAVRRLLATPRYFEAIDALLAADSLYATTAADGTPLDSQMIDYKRFARLAAEGRKRFVFTHSLVPTGAYESTAETGDELLQSLDLTPRATSSAGLGPLRYYRVAERGGFKLWGTPGVDGEAHLRHLRYLGQWLGELGLDELGLDKNGLDAGDRAPADARQ